MKKNYIFCLFVFLSFSLYSQTFRELTVLPEVLSETSGVEITGSNEVWSHNDSGHPEEIYMCDTLGNLLKTLTINNATNRDWEDMTKDDQNNFYFGNIGNNDNDSQELSIYKISDPTLAGNSTTAQKISYVYEDQTEFPPIATEKNFDCEALSWFQGNLYIFTKNRTTPFDAWTYVYKIPDVAGNHTAIKVDSFNTGGTVRNSYWVTAAGISADAKKLAICSQDRVWVFSNFIGDQFFSGDVEEIFLGDQPQREAICFINDHELYLTSEGNRILYHLDINKSTSGGLVNGHFEELTGWDLWASSMTSNCSRNGNKGLEMSTHEAGAEQVMLGLKENTDYRISAYINTNNTDIALGVKGFNGTDKTEITCNSNEFEKFIIDFNTGNQTYATVFLYRFGNTTTVCADDFVLTENPVISNVKNEDLLQGLNAFPNPTRNGMFTLSINEDFQTATMAINDLYGNEIYQQALLSNSKTASIHADLPNGIYIVQVKNQNRVFSTRLIVE